MSILPGNLGGPDNSVGHATLATVRTTIRQRADIVGSSFVTDAELNGYINTSYQELYGLLAQHFGDDYFVSPTPFAITTDGTNDHYDLPSDFFKLLGVDLSVGANQYINLPRFNFADRNRFTYPGAPNAFGKTAIAYRVAGSTLWLSPMPTAGQALRVFYIPRLTTLSADGDTLDGVNGWEEYIVVDVVIRCLQKEESDPGAFMAQKQALIARIEAEAGNRDAGTPSTVVDVLGANAPWGSRGDGGPWGGW